MKQRLLFICLISVQVLCSYSQKEEDVTHYIQNAGFDEDLTFLADGTMKEAISTETSLSNRSWAYIAADNTVYARPKSTSSQNRPDGRKMDAVNGFKAQISGWTIDFPNFPNAEWVYFGSVAYDLEKTAVPISDDSDGYLLIPAKPEAFNGDDNKGFLYLRAGWSNFCFYKQEVKLPCAQYRLEYWTININPNTTATATDLTQIVCRKDIFKDEAGTGFSSQEWVKHEFEFTPTSKFTLQFGYQSGNASSVVNPIVCLDGIKLYKIGEADPVALLKSQVYDCQDLNAQASEIGYSALADYINDYAAYLNNLTSASSKEVIAAIEKADQDIEVFRNAIAETSNIDSILLQMSNLLATTNYPGKEVLETTYNRILSYKDNNYENLPQLIVGATDEGKKAINYYFFSEQIESHVNRLEAAITEVTGKKLAQVTLNRANDLLTSIKENTRYNYDEVDQLGEDITAMISALYNSVSLYAQLLDAINDLQFVVDNYDEQTEIPSGVDTLLTTAITQYTEGSIADSDISSLISEVRKTIEQLNSFIATAEWEILKTAYTQIDNGGGWNIGWDFETDNHSTYQVPGVFVENGHIISIDLSNNNLTGKFPFALLNLPYLEQLNLKANNLTGDIGMGMVAYQQLSPTTTSNLKCLSISGNQFSGNIGLFAHCLTSLTSLDASNNCLEDVYPVIPSTVTTLDISKQTIERVVPLHLANLSVDSIARKVPSILLYDHANQTFTPNINLLCTTPDNMWGMTMAYQNGEMSIPYVSEQNAYYGESGDTLNVAVVYNNGSYEGSTFRISLSFDVGDGNFDGKVNILDLQTTLNYMFEEYTDKPYNFTASNLWKDEVINVQDAVCFVNMLLDVNAASARQLNAAKRVAAQASETSASVTVEDGYLTICSAVPVSAFDIVVSTNQQPDVVSALNEMGFTCTSKYGGNNLHLVGYSLSGAEIPAGETAICELNNGTISYVMLSDRDANEISVSLNGSTTTGVQSTIFNPSSQEVYRIPMGARRAIIIDTTGRKTLIKDEK